VDTGLEGRVAAVTGAASGIGLATARALAAEGCRIVAVDLREELVVELAGENPDSWEPFGADVSSAAGAASIVARALERFGRLDVLVTCAGVYEVGSIDDVDLDVWDRVQSINLRGTYLCAQAAIPAMAKNRWGRIVTLSSMAAETGGYSAGPAYVASKSGVLGLTRHLAHAGGPHGITANCLCPGIIETPMTAVLDEEHKRETAARTPVRRNGTAEDVAAVAVMLASEGAAFVTGAHLDVNGGLVMS
jgi:3-oxoacyl-[acyl-carrier protein] reductase